MQIQSDPIPQAAPGATDRSALPTESNEEFTLAVEVCLLPHSTVSVDAVEDRVTHFLRQEFDTFTSGSICFTGHEFLERNVQRILIFGPPSQTPPIDHADPVRRPWESVISPGGFLSTNLRICCT